MTTKYNAFITGSGAGIGRATAEKLLADGWTVGVYDISGDQSWAEDVPGAIVGTLDVTNPEQWEEALDDFVSQAGRLDLLINNAGILYGGEFIDNSYKGDSAIIDVNVKGVIYGARAAHSHLKAAVPQTTSRPQLINISSAAAIYGTPDMAVYSSSKFAISGFTEALELEWRPEGIRVADIMPLFTNSGMLDDVETDGTKRLGVRLTTDDVASTIVEVVTDGLQAKPDKPAKVHFPVGLQSKLMFLGSHFSPSFLTRFVNAKLTTSRKVEF
ncbi:SDR family oxidoreductase [Corynebacterium sp. TAE3-ERU12]|uniref:SDR family oxidoreductase n=1 Tax=Corynebacterium sp. TAE3-ERU12 TaxID=2849491 RepID=UPI001C4495B8|nr:SDR family oxidoreductase [Corynebacterium sp. TAE3-ERU12]MBV7296000.1 SDR family oxidoreductase [Corynebacterium sp. TAE3-ERU12]